VIVAAGGPNAARMAAEQGDGLIVTAPEKQLVDGYARSGGNGPRYAEVSMCCAASEEEAKRTAHRYFRWSLAGWPVQAELPHDEAFAAASKHVPVEAVAEEVSCGPSVERHLRAIRAYVDAGCDHIILNQIGPDQDVFFKFFESKLLPGLKAERKAA